MNHHKFIEQEFNHFRRGKSHTNPTKEGDIVRLREYYAKSKAHVYIPGRTLPKSSQAEDYLARGSDPIKLKDTLAFSRSSRTT